jgi:sec-independent protein translocase protein TatA
MFGFLPGLGMQEILVLLLLGVLLFGRKLPDIGRSLGKTVVEFRKGVKGLEDEVSGHAPVSRPAIEPDPVRLPQRITASAPAFADAPATSLPPNV